MKKLFILFLAFITHNLFSQEISGTVRDRSNLKAIAYASIFYKKDNIGTYADSTGKFRIQKAQGDTLVISALGFEQSLISTKDIKGALNVSLSPISIGLDEVVINSIKTRKGKKIQIGNLSAKRNLHTSGMKGRTVAYLIKPKTSTRGQIKLLHFGILAMADAMMRVHLFKVNAITGKPDEELVKSPEFIKVKKGSKNLSIDLNHLGIELPFDGVFIGLEWIGEINNNKSVNISPYYTHSKSAEPATVYIKFMDKNWELSPKRKTAIPYKQNGRKTAPEFYFDEPNFKITLVQ